MALYARQSAEKEGSISIETQLEYCRFEARSEPFRIYTDKGFSGKNMQRPEFQQMIEDIKAGRISKVVCYKLDRVSRSILDFAKMMDLLQKYNVEFVSSTEKFDTSTPMGRAMLNICIVFAQLERETIQKRVTDAYHSMAQKGFYLGGRVPYGYRLEDTLLDGKKTSMYVPEPVEMEHICKMFEIYAQPNATYSTVAEYFIKNGISHNRNSAWSRSRISEMLRNPIYVKADMEVYKFFQAQGAQIANPPEDFTGANSCFLYKGRDDKKKFSTIKGQHLVIALNQGFIEPEIWLKCRRKALGHCQISRGSQPKNTWLAGKVKCGKCGYALTVRSSKSGRYFICSGKANNRNCGGAGTIHAQELEDIIFEKIKQKLLDFAILVHKENDVPMPEANEIKLKIARIDNEAESLMDKVASANDTLMRYINDRIAKLDTERTQLQQKLDVHSDTKATRKIEVLENYIERWGDISFDDKRFIVATLIQVVTVSDGEINIHWNI